MLIVKSRKRDSYLFVIQTTLKVLKIVWHKHYLVISSLVSSGHPDKYSYEIPHEFLPGRGKLSGKMISIKRNPYFNLGLFVFKWWFPFSIFATFSGQLYFRRSNFFKLLWSNCFDATVTLSEQLFLQSSCFFKELCFRKIHFLASIIFPEYLIFRSETSSEQPLLENILRKFFRAVTFRKSHFFGGGIA